MPADPNSRTALSPQIFPPRLGRSIVDSLSVARAAPNVQFIAKNRQQTGLRLRVRKTGLNIDRYSATHSAPALHDALLPDGTIPQRHSIGRRHAMKRILLAEDDNDMRQFLTRALKNAGYEVVSF